MANAPPVYSAPPGASSLSRRLKALLLADVPVKCGVYVGLQAPGPHSARHAEAVWSIAHHLVAGSAEQLPHFNTRPPPILRIINAASLGRVDAMGNKMRDFPRDLASELWCGVEERLGDVSRLSHLEKRLASQLMLRLGYTKAAASLLGLESADPATHVFDTEAAIDEFYVLSRLPHDVPALEANVLAAARNRQYSPRFRAIFATYIVVRNGRRGTETPELHEAANLALQALEELEPVGFAQHLLRQTVYRAVAFVPFMQGNLDTTLEILEQGEAEQKAAKDGANDDLKYLSWIDHAFPLYETIAKTHMRLGDIDSAVTATEQLVQLSPNDQRAWDARGQALIKAGRLEKARDAYGQALPLGGLPVARAAYYLGWIHGELGDISESRYFYRLSRKIDPTVPGLEELAAGNCR